VKVVNLEPLWGDELGALLHDDIVYVPMDSEASARQDPELKDADVVVSKSYDETLAGATPALRLLVCPNAGTDRINRSLLPAGARVVNGGGHEIPIAEYVVGGLIALRQQFLIADRGLRAGNWLFSNNRPDAWVGELYGSTVGFIGFGRIGREVLKRLHGFSVRARTVTMHPERLDAESEGIAALGSIANPSDIDALVASADAVVICCELSSLTRGLIDARRLELMKPTAHLVNVSRGAICVERDLFAALRDHRIAGAALDVWYQYPPDLASEPMLPAHCPFQTLDNVIMTPHSSDWTQGQKGRKLALLAAAINDFAREGQDASGAGKSP